MNLDFSLRPLIYVTRDIERALGLPLSTPGYFIISNSTPFAKNIALKHKNVFLIDAGGVPLDTHDLLERDATKEIMTQLPGAEILVFKNTSFIERVCEDHAWTLLNPPAQLANNIEEKVTQLTLLAEIRSLFLPYQIVTGDELLATGKPLVVQFNHSHTGNGTILAKDAKDLQPIRAQFPNRTMRVTEYVRGPIFTNNNVVTQTGVLVGNINYQITGLAPFTRNPFATIGNDWSVPQLLLTPAEREEYHRMAMQVGEALRTRGWRGLFGIDVIMNANTRKLSLMEINARQPASTTFESTLQQKKRSVPPTAVTTFVAHIAALRHTDTPDMTLIPTKNGAQILLRQRKRNIPVKITEALRTSFLKKKYTVMAYTNTAPESDLLRIQSTRGLISNHAVLNEEGKKIAASILKRL